MKKLKEFYFGLHPAVQGSFIAFTAFFFICCAFIAIALTVKLISKVDDETYESTSDLSVMDCKEKLYWLKSNSDSVTLYLFTDRESERWYVEAVIDGQKIETNNAASACIALNSITPLVNAYIESAKIAEEGIEE